MDELVTFAERISREAARAAESADERIGELRRTLNASALAVEHACRAVAHQVRSAENTERAAEHAAEFLDGLADAHAELAGTLTEGEG